MQQGQALRAEIGALDLLLRQERGKPAAEQSADLVASLGARIAASQREYEGLLTRLKLADPETAALMTVAPLTLAEVQRLLDADTTLLSYFVTPDRTLAFLVTRDGLRTVELPVDERSLRDTINRFRAFAAPSDAAETLAQLADWLLAPLADQITTPVVGIIPHGVLHYLPFAALPQGADTFGEAYTLFHLPSASTLPFVEQKRKDAAASVLALAYSRPEGLPRLRFADVEVETVARSYGSPALVDAAATLTEFKLRAADAPIVHLAAHAELSPTSPLFSRILLAPDAQNDGSLTVQDVYGLNLARADLVVLSACDTQLRSTESRR